MNNKKGLNIDKDVLMSLVIGLLVVGIGLYFLLHNPTDNSLQVCKQSVILRANAPEIQAGGINFVTLKDRFPLKCTSEVLVIDFNDTQKAENLIAEELAQCWYLFGQGEKQIFRKFTGQAESFCVPCARIHFSTTVSAYYTQEKNSINIQGVMDKPLKNTGISYKEYLRYALIGNFEDKKNWMDDSYSITGTDFSIDDRPTTGLNDISLKGTQAKMNLPSTIDYERGDLLIFFNQIVGSGADQDSNIFWFQSGQKTPNPYKEMTKDFQSLGIFEGVSLCDEFDGIPA